ncbi:hypothetical protein QTJ16_002821 [Diplocarpon rosae]|uniref:Uncharacterized protein n=1 Tax=Diplocarpon rosae TaxID=946125 RepID=A0AAD9T4K0_9HELO|nr:hypothetical protein QTJ16_002821 [Diplocarpon rosae]
MSQQIPTNEEERPHSVHSIASTRSTFSDLSQSTNASNADHSFLSPEEAHSDATSSTVTEDEEDEEEQEAQSLSRLLPIDTQPSTAGNAPTTAFEATEEAEGLSLPVPPPLLPTDQEVQDFSALAQELALFASCLSSVPAQTSEAAVAAEKERKETLKKDLLELVATPEQVALVGRIDKLLEDWKGVHESVKEWRREWHGEAVSAALRRQRETTDMEMPS